MSSRWDRFTETSFNATIMAKNLPDILPAGNNPRSTCIHVGPLEAALAESVGGAGGVEQSPEKVRKQLA